MENPIEFCPKCKSVMIPAGKVIKCRKCGYEKKTEGSIILDRSKPIHEEITILDTREDMGLPTTDVRCGRCGNRKAWWWMLQLHKADEAPTRFYRCTRCGKTWRSSK